MQILRPSFAHLLCQRGSTALIIHPFALCVARLFSFAISFMCTSSSSSNSTTCRSGAARVVATSAASSVTRPRPSCVRSSRAAFADNTVTGTTCVPTSTRSRALYAPDVIASAIAPKCVPISGVNSIALYAPPPPFHTHTLHTSYFDLGSISIYLILPSRHLSRQRPKMPPPRATTLSTATSVPRRATTDT